MTLYVIEIYKNAHPPAAYQPDHRLTLTFSYWLRTVMPTTPLQAADFAAETFTCDLEDLEAYRGDGGHNEERFLAACTYHLLGNAKLTVGDVVSVTTDTDEVWLAWERTGWRAIAAPPHTDGQPLTANTIHHHLNRDL